MTSSKPKTSVRMPAHARKEDVQSELKPQPEPERIHRDKTAGLHGAVILNEAKILRNDVETGAEERADKRTTMKKARKGVGEPDHAQMQDR